MATESVSAHPATQTRTPQTESRVHRVLVIANETVGGRELLEEIRHQTEGRQAEVKVVAPALVDSRLKQAFGEVDEGRVRATARLEESVRAISQLGVKITGGVGDADPNQAIEDALRTFDADEVIIATHPPERSTWLENDVVQRAHEELSIPVTHVVVDLSAASEAEQVRLIEHIQPRLRGRGDEEHPDYLPPMRTRDRIGLVVGIVGTVVLGILALTCQDNGSFSGGCAVRLAIFGGAFFITLWHSVALLLMGSVRYRGFFNDLAADMVLYGIPPAIVISLLFD
jgi:hypothetical protein